MYTLNFTLDTNASLLIWLFASDNVSKPLKCIFLTGHDDRTRWCGQTASYNLTVEVKRCQVKGDKPHYKSTLAVQPLTPNNTPFTVLCQIESDDVNITRSTVSVSHHTFVGKFDLYRLLHQ